MRQLHRRIEVSALGCSGERFDIRILAVSHAQFRAQTLDRSGRIGGSQKLQAFLRPLGIAQQSGECKARILMARSSIGRRSPEGGSKKSRGLPEPLETKGEFSSKRRDDPHSGAARWTMFPL